MMGLVKKRSEDYKNTRFLFNEAAGSRVADLAHETRDISTLLLLHTQICTNLPRVTFAGQNTDSFPQPRGADEFGWTHTKAAGFHRPCGCARMHSRV